MCYVISVPCKLPHRKTLNFKSKSIYGCLKYLFGKNYRHFYVFIHHGSVWIHEFTKEWCLFVNTHVRIQIYREFYHRIIYIADEGRHVKIINNRIKYPLCSTQFTPVCRQCLYLPIDNINVQTWTITSISPIDNFHFLSSNIPTPRA